MNYVRRTHNGLDYAKVEVYDEHGNAEEYEVNKHLADAINNMHRKLQLHPEILSSQMRRAMQTQTNDLLELRD